LNFFIIVENTDLSDGPPAIKNTDFGIVNRVAVWCFLMCYVFSF